MIMTAAARAMALIEEHGSVRLAARVLGMDHAHLHKIAMGKKAAAKATLKKLGLCPTPYYETRQG
jgi:molybdenum-dependent DNA-binding transcriptional regulator ModE